MSEVTVDRPKEPQPAKQRHGCLTTYLTFMIIVNSAVSLIYLFGSEWLRKNGLNTPDWAFRLLAVGGFFNLICAVALFRWKKWGFWGCVASAVAVFVVNLSIGLGPGSAFGGVVGIALLYGVLHIGKEKKGWPQLE